MHSIKFFVLLGVIIASEAQRPFYAGSRPIGYPETETNSLLLNRFGENEGPIEARGDGNLVNRLNQMPLDKRPFWFINAQAYDELRKNPQTYPVAQNSFSNKN